MNPPVHLLAFQLDEDQALCADPGSIGANLPIFYMRPVQTLLMAMASRQALMQANPAARPVVISRSGCPGLQRYCVQTWSGDNRTSWRTLQVSCPWAIHHSKQTPETKTKNPSNY